jgi:hypothetical protein
MQMYFKMELNVGYNKKPKRSHLQKSLLGMFLKASRTRNIIRMRNNLKLNTVISILVNI